MKRPSSLRHGFTIVELIIVIAVIAILAALVAVGYNGIQTSARDKALLTDIEAVEAELARYAVKNDGTYASSLNWDSSVGVNTNIKFIPSEGNVIIVTTTGKDYCIKAYSPRSNHKTLEDAVSKGECTFKWAKVIAGALTSCGVGMNGQAYCWGSNTYGQLGDGTTTQSLEPVAMSTGAGLSGVDPDKFGFRVNHGCAATVNGSTLYCWGNNSSGRLGDGTTTTGSGVPVAVVATGVLAGKQVRSVDVGLSHTCAITIPSGAYCWGGNGADGQMGNGTTSPAANPNPLTVTSTGVLSGKTLTKLSVGTHYTCALDSAGAGYCWGANSYGQRGTTGASTVPNQIPMTGALSGKSLVEVSAAQDHTCVVTSDSGLYCWGRDTMGQIGDGTPETAVNSTAYWVNGSGVLAGIPIKKVATGTMHTCALSVAGDAYCWGVQTNGRLGNGVTSSTTKPTPGIISRGEMPASAKIVDISAGSSHTCAVTDAGEGYCWGQNTNGQLGNGLSAASGVPVKVKTPY